MHTSMRRVDRPASLFPTPPSADRPLRTQFLAGLCMLLVLLAATLSVTHSHPSESGIHPDCGLCVAAHMALNAAAEPPSLPALRVFIEPSAPQPILRPRAAIQPAHYSRPPPAEPPRS